MLECNLQAMCAKPIGIHLLHELNKIIDKNDLGLNKDNDCIILRNSNRQITGKTRKIRIFKNMGLDKRNLKVDFLDVALNVRKRYILII